MSTYQPTTQNLLESWQNAIQGYYFCAWIIAAALSFAVGANDCANSFGTAVGSKTLTLRHACYLAAFFETFGAVFMSAMVGSTIRKGIFDPDQFASFTHQTGNCYKESKCRNYTMTTEGYLLEVYCPVQMEFRGKSSSCSYPYSTDGFRAKLPTADTTECNYSPALNTSDYGCTEYGVEYAISEKELAAAADDSIRRPELELVYIHSASMVASAGWQLFATTFSLPVSGTHSIIGALVGGAVAARGFDGINWGKVGGIVASWVTSPLFSCILAFLTYKLIGGKVVAANDPLKAVRFAFPIMMAICTLFNSYALILIQCKACKLKPATGFFCTFPFNIWKKGGDFGPYTMYLGALVLAVPISITVLLFSYFVLLPWYRKNDTKLINTIGMVAINEGETEGMLQKIGSGTGKLMSIVEEKEGSGSSNTSSGSNQKLVKVNSIDEPPVYSADMDANPENNQQVKVHGRFTVNAVAAGPKKGRTPSYKTKAYMLNELAAQTMRAPAMKYHRSVDDMYLAGDDEANYYSFPGHRRHRSLADRRNDSNQSNLSHDAVRESHRKPRTISASGAIRTLSAKILNRSSSAGARTRHVSDSITHQVEKTHPNDHPAVLSRNINSFDSPNGIPPHRQSILKRIHENSDSELSEVQVEEVSCIIRSGDHQQTSVTSQEKGLTFMVGEDGMSDSEVTGTAFANEKSITSDAPAPTGISLKKNVTINMEPAQEQHYVPVTDIVENYFKRLQVLAACCSSLAHGGNDTANAIAPLVGIYLLNVYGPVNSDSTVFSNAWLFAYGGLFMSVGLFILGKRCIETIGGNICEVVPSSGFTTSMVAVLVVQASTVLGLPVSSTHCQVGAVIGIGLIGGFGQVKWSLMKNVALAWVLTLPATGIISFVIVKILLYVNYGF